VTKIFNPETGATVHLPDPAPSTIVHGETGEVLHFVTLDAEGRPVYGRKSVRQHGKSSHSTSGGGMTFTGRT
jgi:hypothetical protein